jgi:hypothetical protein
MTDTQEAISKILVETLKPYVDRIALLGSQARGDGGPTRDEVDTWRLRVPLFRRWLRKPLRPVD